MFKIYFHNLPVKATRLIKHLSLPFLKQGQKNNYPSQGIFEWCSDLFFYIIDVFGIPEIYEFILGLIKLNTRSLSAEEIKLAKSVFHDSLNYDVIKIDDGARFGTIKIALAYVSFNTINYYKKIRKEILIHELMHVWQYQKYGAIYIPRAIKAQRSKEGYDYGGVPNLYKTMLTKGRLSEFNMEQQADIIEDFYKIQNETQPESLLNKNIYAYFASQILE